MLLILLFVLLVSSSSSDFISSSNASETGIESRVAGGESVNIKDYPYQVGVQINGRQVCGGAIITRKWIVTAAHCILRNATLVYTIRAGSSFRNASGTVYDVDKIIEHENYTHNNDGTTVNDIALIRIKGRFQFDDTRKAIRLFRANEEVKAGSEAVVSGWGDVSEGKPAFHLQAAKLIIINGTDCQNAFENVKVVLTKKICAVSPDKPRNSCKGDSGGPLVVKNRLAGIVAWGTKCGESPVVYAKVSAYRRWIDRHINLFGFFF